MVLVLELKTISMLFCLKIEEKSLKKTVKKYSRMDLTCVIVIENFNGSALEIFNITDLDSIEIETSVAFRYTVDVN